MFSLNDVIKEKGDHCFNTIKIKEGVEDDLDNLNSDFTLDKKVETFLLKGSYAISKVIDEDKSVEDWIHYDCKLAFSIGYVLYNKDTPNIEKLIKLIIHFTSNPPPVQTTHREEMRSGTVCPSKETICEVDGKQFTLYGRYIFGYDHYWFVKFKSREKSFKLNAVRGKERENDYNYSFAIVDKNTKVLDAFGLYC